MLSTMSLDFMQFNKPIVNTVFGNKKNGLYNDQRFFKYKHIENVLASNSTTIVKNENELLLAINTYLSNSNLDSENRKNFIKLQIGKSLEGTSKRIAQTLLEWTN